MKKKIICMMISGLMVLSLILASCGGEEDTGGKVTTEDKGQTVTVGGDDDTKQVGDDKEPAIEPSGEPQYGGTHNIALAWDVSNWANGLEFC